MPKAAVPIEPLEKYVGRLLVISIRAADDVALDEDESVRVRGDTVQAAIRQLENLENATSVFFRPTQNDPRVLRLALVFCNAEAKEQFRNAVAKIAESEGGKLIKDRGLRGLPRGFLTPLGREVARAERQK